LIFVDTNILLDVLQDDSRWGTWSLQALESAGAQDVLAINPVIYAELSIAFARIEELEQVLADAALTVEPIPREGLFLAGKALCRRARSGNRLTDSHARRRTVQDVLPDRESLGTGLEERLRSQRPGDNFSLRRAGL
jgi:predicted nucleic acid-binding protein